MVNYVSKGFLDKIDQMLRSSDSDILSGMGVAKSSLLKLLMALPLNTESAEKINRETYANPKSFKDHILKSAIKKNQLNQNSFNNLNSNIENLSAYYFLDNNNAINLSNKYGIACKDSNYNCDSFYNDCTITDLPIKDSWEPVKKGVPPVNAMMIIDPYIFGIPFEKKLRNLISYIKLYKRNLEIPFHLTILFSSEKKGKYHCIPAQIQKAFDELSSINNLELRLYSDNNLPISDRLIFTNYTSGNIGHPFDGRDTRFTQNFLGVEDSEEKILRNYKNYKKDLIKWNIFLNKIPKYMGSVQSIWETSDFKNRLFAPIVEKS